MDNNKKDKFKNFLRKEGFYIILFLCLCVVAGVTVVKTTKDKGNEKAEEPQNEFTYNIDKNEVTSENQKQNADRVQNETENEIAEVPSEVANEDSNMAVEEEVNVSAGSNTEIKFNKPLDGSISREYTFPAPQVMKDGTHRNIRGIDVKAKVGAEVTAIAIGEVKEVSNKAEEGDFVVIAHANGINSKYCNLSSDIKVKVGDKVTEKTVIGTVGDSSKIFTNKEFGEHLNIQVHDSNGKDLDPTKYLEYK